MLDRKTVFEILKLHRMGLSQREIHRRLNIGRDTVARYLDDPFRLSKQRKPKGSKLDPYRPLIKELLAAYPEIKAPVVLREIKKKRFVGEITLVRTFLRELRRTSSFKTPYIRFESDPGEQMQVDWGHFNTIEYGETKRKLYALAVIESHSRMLHVTFTHSQKQEVLHQCLLNAFAYFGGTPKELVVDNMLTAVIERAGSIIRFNDAFLDFMMKLHINPVACNVRSPQEKGKIESAIKYLRNNFFPARTFCDLEDINLQVRAWLDDTANVREHKTTGQRPVDRIIRSALSPLPKGLPDCRETGSYLVHKDFSVRFDKNVYTAPTSMIGEYVTLKADHQRVSFYYKDKLLASHERCWQRCKRIELPEHQAQAKKRKAKRKRSLQEKVFLSLGSTEQAFLEKINSTHQNIRKSIESLLKLRDEYGEKSLLYAMDKAMKKGLYGSDYVENILYQEMTPAEKHQPVKLEKEELNSIRLTSPSLKEYDAIALKRRRSNNGKNKTEIYNPEIKKLLRPY